LELIWTLGTNLAGLSFIIWAAESRSLTCLLRFQLGQLELDALAERFQLGQA